MCTTCLRYRDAEHSHVEGSYASVPPVWEGSPIDFLNTPMSRGQMLRASGGALGLALAAGPLGLGTVTAGAAPLPYVVLIVLDGARPDYFNVPGIPHVRSLMQRGTQYPHAFAGILESETPSGHTSIGTGSEPRYTGIPSFWWANSDNIQVSLFDPAKVRAGAMERIIRNSGVPTLAGLVHGKNPRASVVALSGSKYYAADAIGGPEADVIMYFNSTSDGQFVPTFIPGHSPDPAILTAPGLAKTSASMPPGAQNRLAMKLAATTFSRMRQQVTLINLPEFDWPLGHVHGGIMDARGVKTLMQGFDADLAMLQETYRKAGVLDRTIFVLTADHGMMPLVYKIPKTEISNAVTRAGTTLISEAYTSGAYLWLKDASRARTAAQNITNLNDPHIQSVYARVQTPQGFLYTRVSSGKRLRGAATEVANQYLLQSFNGANAPDVAVLFTEGAGSEPGGQSSWKADHGGASWESQHLPLILSGPGVRPGHVSSHPARLIDIAPTVLQLMGISSSRMQGIPLADALKTAPAAAMKRQRAVATRLQPLVAALQQQSRTELTRH